MRRTALHEYLSQIEGLLDENRLPEAAAHCHFILQQYPRHVDTYRLFGRALLEQQLFDEAADVFTRLLSADPEDLISHAGLALAYSENRDLQSAIWHMERAFEIDPYNRAVQDELRKLYISRDGDMPPRLALTRAALARLHFRGALYRQAINEFTDLLAEDPERLDLQLALADTLYWDSRRVEAADVCQRILTQLPYCVKANAILADAWLRSDRVEEAREQLRRLQQLTLLDRAHLDPDTTLGRALGNGRIQLPETVQVEALDDSQAMAHGLDEAVAWPDQTAALVMDGEQVPEWLLEIDTSEAELDLESELAQDRQFRPEAGMPGEPEPESEPEEIMDWLEEAATAEEPEPEPDLYSSDPRPAVPDPEMDQDAVLDDLIVATAVEDELWLMSADEEYGVLESTAPEASHVEEVAETADGAIAGLVASEGLEEQVDVLADDQALPDLTDRATKEEEPVTQPAAWDDDTLLALDDLRAYIDEGGDAEKDRGAAPEWLGELSGESEVTDELPEWLYEAIGMEAQPRAAEQGDSLDWPEEETTGSGDEGQGRPGGDEVDIEAAFEVNEESDDFADDLDQSGFEADFATSSERDGVPEWLLAADDVLEDLPPELINGTKSEPIDRPGLEEDTATWLDELAQQLSATDDEPATPDGTRDE